MGRRFPFFLAIFLFPVASFGQSNSSDSQTLQALLSEVRQLRQELESSLAKVESAQILLARLQAQQSLVSRASQRLDDLRSKVADVQNREKNAAQNLKRFQDQLAAEENPANQKQLQDLVEHFKTELETSTNDEQQTQTAEIDAEQQLRIEQDKLDALQAQLDDIVKSLNAGTGSGSSPH